MAEIKIEKKKGMPIWALLLALVLLVVLVWAALAMRNNHRQAPQNTAVLEWSVGAAPVASIALTEPTDVLARCA
jgi:hypothetical protein